MEIKILEWGDFVEKYWEKYTMGSEDGGDKLREIENEFNFQDTTIRKFFESSSQSIRWKIYKML